MVRTIVSDPAANLRDPTQPLFDAVTGQWHLWATRILKKDGKPGYLGRVWHYHSTTDDINSTWVDGGEAIGTSPTPGAFDHTGVFTPSAAREVDGSWVLFYGGVPDASPAHYESIGIATAATPLGPWTKSPLNPIVTPAYAAGWCNVSDTPARVDEAEPYVIGGRAMLYVKAVCANATALPTLFVSKPSLSGSEGTAAMRWKPPFVGLSEPPYPIIAAAATRQDKGFEQCRIFTGPDGNLHMTGNDHGGGGQPHFVATDASGLNWKLLGYFSGVFGVGAAEPTPVVPPGAVAPAGVPPHWIQFSGGKGLLRLQLLNVTWSPNP